MTEMLLNVEKAMGRDASRNPHTSHLFALISHHSPLTSIYIIRYNHKNSINKKSFAYDSKTV